MDFEVQTSTITTIWLALEAFWWLLVMVGDQHILEIGDSFPATAGYSHKLLCDCGM